MTTAANSAASSRAESSQHYNLPDATGHFGQYGGSFVSETLTYALTQLRAAYAHYSQDQAFLDEFHNELTHFVGRPSPIYHAKRWSEIAGGAQIYAAAMPLADRLVITHVALRPEGDARFPPIDPSAWQLAEEAGLRRGERDSADFAIRIYRRAPAAR